MNRILLITLLPIFLFSNIALANDQKLAIEIELPRFNVAEYHKPYVAIWLEDANRHATQIGLWYDLDMNEDKGKKWLKDIRQWWRRVGRKAEQPFDGITSATKGPGKHNTLISLDSVAFSTLPDGEYQIRIEASREVGGKEVVNIPLNWPLQNNKYPLVTSGNNELSTITIKLANTTSK